MKHLLLLLSIVALLPPISAQSDFKVIGYLPYYRFGHNAQIEYERLTHLNLAFANPDMQGNLSLGGQDIEPILQSARQAGLSVFLSLAGGALTNEWEQAWEHLMLPENRSAFIHKIVQYVEGYELDGVDFDLEWGHVNEKYSPFVLELRDSLTAHNLLLTAALPATYRYPQISDQALAAFDWINIMAYDLTGSWDPNNPGPHSPYSFALSSIFYWRGQGVADERLTLGVPFYGYQFAGPNVTAHSYRTIVGWDPANAYQDQAGQTYYNGIPTIQSKTELALSQVSGLMIWELGQDAFSELSLLRAIDETINGTSPTEAEVAGDLAIQLYPNPFQQQLQLENPSAADWQVQLLHFNGQPIGERSLPSGGSLSWDTAALPAGFYLLRARNAQAQHTYKLIKH